MPSSTTAGAMQPASWRSRSSVSGTPMWLLKLPAVAKRAVAEPGAQDRRDHLRHRRLAVAAGHRDQRQAEARAPGRGERPPSARWLSATSRPAQAGFGEAALGERRDGARSPSPAARKSCASKRSPRSATNRSPGAALRVSLCTRVDRDRRVADERATAAACACAAPSVIIVVPALAARARERGARLAASVRERVLRRRRCPGSPRGPCRRSGSRRARPASTIAWRDRVGAVLDHVDLVVADHAGEDLRQDEVGRLEARVVAGDDDVVGEPAGDRAHQRPLGGVAVAAAAEHAPELAAALGGERPQRRQRLLERIRRVGVVDDDLRARVRRPERAACGRAPASARCTRSLRRRA